MKQYKTDRIRNVAFLGHSGSGKTSLVEAILYRNKEIDRLGKTEDGNTVSDYDPEEIKRGISISTTVIPTEWKDCKINILDTPGYFDFYGEVSSAVKVAGGAVIVVDATSGVQVGTEKAWEYVTEREMPTIIVVNRLDRENSQFFKVIDDLREKFGKKVAPFQIPLGFEADFKSLVDVAELKAYKTENNSAVEMPIPDGVKDRVEEMRSLLIESVAETDEEMMEKFFDGVEFSQDEIRQGLRKGVLSGEIVPILCTSATLGTGVASMLDSIVSFFPSISDSKDPKGLNPKTNQQETRRPNADDSFSGFVFKTIADPYVGKLSLVKLLSGKLNAETPLYNSTKEKNEKVNQILIVKGKKQTPIQEAIAGDIVALSKLQHTETGDTLCVTDKPIIYKGIDFPSPCISLGIRPKSKGDEDKIGGGLSKLREEDPTFTVFKNPETHQTLISGQGEVQIEVVANKLKSRFGVDVELEDMIVPFRETIKGSARVQGKHKKQSGGHGQYGDVWIEFSRSDQDFEFEEKIFGGSVPKSYIPAVEKGLRDCLVEGVLAGYPVVNLKAVLVDGSYHNVDSSEMAFKMAASIAFKKGLQEAKSVLLEPIAKLEILIPDDYLGDVMGDVNKRRGRILGMEQISGKQKVVAEIPQTEVLKYATDLRSMTQARGSFTIDFARYEEVPSNIADKVIEAAKALKEKE